MSRFDGIVADHAQRTSAGPDCIRRDCSIRIIPFQRAIVCMRCVRYGFGGSATGGRDAPRLRIGETLCTVVANWDAIAHGVGGCRVRRAMALTWCVRHGFGGYATRWQGRTPAMVRGDVAHRRCELGRHCTRCCRCSSSMRDGLDAVRPVRFWWLRHPGAGSHPGYVLSGSSRGCI